MTPCLVVTAGPDVLPRSGVNRLRPAGGDVPAWLPHVPPEPGGEQRKRIDHYIFDAHPRSRTRGYNTPAERTSVVPPRLGRHSSAITVNDHEVAGVSGVRAGIRCPGGCVVGLAVGVDVGVVLDGPVGQGDRMRDQGGG